MNPNKKREEERSSAMMDMAESVIDLAADIIVELSASAASTVVDHGCSAGKAIVESMCDIGSSFLD